MKRLLRLFGAMLTTLMTCAANAQGIPVIHVQHVANSKMGIAPFFNEGTPGAAIHPSILAAAPKASVVVKEFADSFEKTNLEETLTKLGVTELLVCGMMTQNCVLTRRSRRRRRSTPSRSCRTAAPRSARFCT